MGDLKFMKGSDIRLKLQQLKMDTEYQEYCLDSLKIEFDWKLEEGMKILLNRAEELPDDLTKERGMDWWEVQDQGKSYSCSPASLATGLLWYHLGKKAMKLSHDANDQQKSEMLKMPSTRFLWLASKEFDDEIVYPTTFLENQPTSLKAALRILRKYGCLSEEQFGIKEAFVSDKTLKEAKVETVYFHAAFRRINAYINLKPGTEIFGAEKSEKHIANIIFWLRNMGPVAIKITVPTELDDAKSKSYQFDGTPGGGNDLHALCIVGYENKYFILRNTWGKEWGLSGHAHVSKDYLIQIMKESYGIIIK